MDRAPPHPRPAPPARAPVTRLGVLVLKPSRYDDDGYVIEWRRVYMPSHSLAAVGGIVDDARRREVLGPGVEIAIHLHDETQGVLTPA